MQKKIESEKMGRSNLGWLNSWFHFSFAEYYNPSNMNYGVLRVLNDDLIEPGTGFDMHPHRDMEIITYVVDGELTHGDSMNNKRTLRRGEVQYMSAGSGVIHSEHNLGEEQLRLLQIWIIPDRKNSPPQYGDYRFPWEERVGRWLHLVSGPDGNAPIRIRQDIDLSVTLLPSGGELEYELARGRQVYLVQIEGTSEVGDLRLHSRDAAELSGMDRISIQAESDSHLLLFDMKASIE